MPNTRRQAMSRPEAPPAGTARPARRGGLPPPRPDGPRVGRRARRGVRAVVRFGGEFAADSSAPGSDSEQAQQLLERALPGPVRRHGRRRGARRRRHVARGAKSDVTALLAELGDRAARRRASTTLPDPGRDLRRRPDRRRRRCAWTSSTRSTCRSRTASGCSTSPSEADRDGLSVALGGQTHPARRAGRDRLRGHRPGRRRDHPAAHVRLRGRRRPAAPRRRRRARRQQHPDRPADRASSTRPTGPPRWPR